MSSIYLFKRTLRIKWNLDFCVTSKFIVFKVFLAGRAEQSTTKQIFHSDERRLSAAATKMYVARAR